VTVVSKSSFKVISGIGFATVIFRLVHLNYPIQIKTHNEFIEPTLQEYLWTVNKYTFIIIDAFGSSLAKLSKINPT
jgi:hypothetical protein